MRPRTGLTPTTLLGSFLLFEIQLPMAKRLLPWFGGVAGVWTLCFLFFQVLLVVGFAWGDWLTRQSVTRQRLLQTGLILASFASLPNVGVIAWKLQGTEDPAPLILGLLVASPGLPGLVLASSGMVLAGWSRRTFALLNAGGLLGLVIYVALVEPWLTPDRQVALWRGAYVAFGILVAARLWLRGGAPVVATAGVVPNRAVSAALAAIPVALLLVVTLQLSEAFVAAPLVWGVPFALYLLSLVVAFGAKRRYSRLVRMPLGVLALAVVLLTTHPGVVVGAVFVLFLVCHGELSGRAPEPVTIAAGGVFGAAAVVAIPALVFSLVVVREPWQRIRTARVHTRNFFGSLLVSEGPVSGAPGAIRVLRQDGKERGAQFPAEENQKLATGYYGQNSGVGLALEALQPKGALSVGVFGLGSGTIFTYARPRDRYLVYELNPVLLNVASSQFTFMGDTEVARDIRLGDPRVSLERQLPRNFDLLAIDAPASGTVPVHLLTEEAFALYWKHLRADGVLAVNVWGGHLSLAPVVEVAARITGKQARLVHRDGDPRTAEFTSDWVLVTSRPGFFEIPELQGRANTIPPVPGLQPWTDDYSNLCRSLR